METQIQTTQISAEVTLSPTSLKPVTNTPTMQSIPASPTPSAIPPVFLAETTQDFSSYTYEIINVYPHDFVAFTQGLIYKDGFLYESTGRHGHSSLRKTELETGKILNIYELPEELFAEGLGYYNNQLFQLTWQENTGFIYNFDSFSLLDTFKYPTEGWGLTFTDKELVMSDGSNTLYFYSPEDMQEIRRVSVFDETNTPLEKINELEYISGLIFANIWQTDNIVIIDPHSGNLKGMINLQGLLDVCQLKNETDVLNGIAYDPNLQRLFVTGKLWPCLFEIRIIPE